MSPAPYRPPTPPPPRPMGPQMGQAAARRASTYAAAGAQRAVADMHAGHRRNVLPGTGRAARRRRRSLPVRLVGLVFRLAFVVVWLAVAIAIVAFAIQQSNGG
jgi:hypothetical protein